MDKSIILSALLLASAGANAAYADLSTFQTTRGYVVVTSDSVTLTGNTGGVDDNGDPEDRSASGYIDLDGVQTFEYSIAGYPATIFGSFPAAFSVVQLQPSTGYSLYHFSSPYSGRLSFTAGSPLLGTSSLSLRNFDTIAAAVPEPETYAMLMAGLAITGFIARRQKRKENQPLKISTSLPLHNA